MINCVESSDGKKILRAGWVAPMDRPPLRDGAVVFQSGIILDVGHAGEVLRRNAGAEVIDRPDEIVIPGLINAHAHLELSEFIPGAAPGDFVEWLMRLVPQGQVTAATVQGSVARSIPIGVQQCLRFGVTCVGDISRHCALTRPLLGNGPLRVVSYGEVQAMARRRELLDERLAVAIDNTHASPCLRIAISPHAPYSIEIEGYRRCLEAARARRLPLATHLAETADEAAFLENHQGRFRDLWNYLGAWDDRVPRTPGGPIRFAKSIALLDYDLALLAHVNYCDDDELDLLAGGSASVAYCPRTHAYFGHPPHRWRDMLNRGINVAVGTDSCASSPDLNLVDDLRVLRKLAPDLPAQRLWEMATVRAARAIGMDQQVGTLRPGLAADLVMFGAMGDDPLAEILESTASPREMWIGGTELAVSNGM
jgi:cytosine/adenosine deaminase-related metal-dependent hydrolase